MADFPPDRFDDVPEHLGRVGAHRAPRAAGRRWIIVGWSALATGVIVLAGVLGLGLVDDRLAVVEPTVDAESEQPVEEGPASVTPVTDPSSVELDDSFTITILDGTGADSPGPRAASALESLGWPVGTVTAAAQSDVQTTTIFYSEPQFEGVALGLTVLLDVGVVELSDAFPGAPITIVLGSDYSL
jgi:hypothetical protein